MGIFSKGFFSSLASSFFSRSTQQVTTSKTNTIVISVGGKVNNNNTVQELYAFQADTGPSENFDPYCQTEAFTRCGLQTLGFSCTLDEMVNSNWCESTDPNTGGYPTSAGYNESLYTCKDYLPIAANVQCLEDQLTCCISEHAKAMTMVVGSGFLMLLALGAAISRRRRYFFDVSRSKETINSQKEDLKAAVIQAGISPSRYRGYL